MVLQDQTAVDLAAVANSGDGDDRCLVVNGIDDPVVPRTDTEVWSVSLERCRTRGPRFVDRASMVWATAFRMAGSS
jgi:hypothetical protein